MKAAVAITLAVLVALALFPVGSARKGLYDSERADDTDDDDAPRVVENGWFASIREFFKPAPTDAELRLRERAEKEERELNVDLQTLERFYSDEATRSKGSPTLAEFQSNPRYKKGRSRALRAWKNAQMAHALTLEEVLAEVRAASNSSCHVVTSDICNRLRLKEMEDNGVWIKASFGEPMYYLPYLICVIAHAVIRFTSDDAHAPTSWKTPAAVSVAFLVFGLLCMAWLRYLFTTAITGLPVASWFVSLILSVLSACGVFASMLWVEELLCRCNRKCCPPSRRQRRSRRPGHYASTMAPAVHIGYGEGDEEPGLAHEEADDDDDEAETGACRDEERVGPVKPHSLLDARPAPTAPSHTAVRAASPTRSRPVSSDARGEGVSASASTVQRAKGPAPNASSSAADERAVAAAAFAKAAARAASRRMTTQK
jgi:hypothetical protein